MRIYIKNTSDCEIFKEDLAEFRDSLYIPLFPNEDEREPFENIINRIKNGGTPETRIILAKDNGRVIGGIVTDYLTEDIAQPIYLVVKEEYRRKGVGRDLFESSVRNYGNVFIEIDNPETVSVENSGMDPAKRKEMYEKWGFKQVPIKYAQPPLSKDGNYEYSMLLMYRTNITKKTVKTFLDVFYSGLSASDSRELIRMKNEIDCATF